MNELSDDTRNVIAGQGWDENTVLVLIADFLRRRDLEEDLFRHLANIADEENAECYIDEYQ